MRSKLPYVLVAVCAAVIAPSLLFGGPRLVIDVLDVGQGDAVLAQCGRVQLLIDGGPDRAVLAQLGRAMPLGDRRIELVLVTHPHADHVAGLSAVFERYDVGAVLTSGIGSSTPEHRAFEDAVRGAGLSPASVAEGDAIALGRCARFDVLWPERGTEAPDDPNDASIVLMARLSDGTAAALLMGDATAEVERRLLGKGIDLGAAVLKVGHHGSRFSTTPEFLDAVRPEAAVISVGRNGYGHPAWAVLRRLRGRGIAVMRTDAEGAVRATFGPGGPRLRRR